MSSIVHALFSAISLFIRLYYSIFSVSTQQYLFYPYTDYTPYTRYTINPGKTTGNRIPAWLIRTIYKRTRPMMQAQPCIPAEYGG